MHTFPIEPSAAPQPQQSVPSESGGSEGLPLVASRDESTSPPGLEQLNPYEKKFTRRTGPLGA